MTRPPAASPVARLASWILLLTVAQNILYEVLWRGVVHAGASEFDSTASVVNALVVSVIVAGAAYFIRQGKRWASWVAIAYAAVVFVGTILVYFPTMYLARNPGIVENTATTTLVALFGAATALLLYDLRGGGMAASRSG